MKALGDLNMGDCGKRITLSQDTPIPTTVSGPLRYVEQHTEWISDKAIGDPEVTYTPGRRTTTIQVGSFRAELSAEQVCVLD